MKNTTLRFGILLGVLTLVGQSSIFALTKNYVAPANAPFVTIDKTEITAGTPVMVSWKANGGTNCTWFVTPSSGYRGVVPTSPFIIKTDKLIGTVTINVMCAQPAKTLTKIASKAPVKPNYVMSQGVKLIIKPAVVTSASPKLSR